MKLTVFGWTGYNRNDKRFKESQLRCICAAPSMAFIMRKYGLSRSDLRNICPTGNVHELKAAMEQPMVALAAGLNESLRNSNRTYLVFKGD